MVNITTVFISVTLNLLLFSSCTSLVLEETVVVTAEGDELLLEGYTAHYEFSSAFDKLIQTKIQTAVQEILSNSRIKPGLLLSELDYKQYMFLNLLHALSLKDINFANLLIELFSEMSTGLSTVLNNDLLTSIDFPKDFMYRVIKSLAESNLIGLTEVPHFLSNDILKLTNATKIFNKACSEGNLEIVKWFLNLNNSYASFEVIRLAWANNHWEVVRILLQNMSVAEQRPTKELSRMVNVKNESLLYFAVEANRSDIVKILIENGAVVDLVSSDSLTPLHKAVEVNCLECIELLENGNASLTSSLLQLAIQKNNDLAFKKIVKSNISKGWEDNEGMSPLYISVRKTIVSFVKSLLGPELHIIKDLKDIGIEESVLYEALCCQSEHYMSFSEVYENQFRIMKHMNKQAGIFKYIEEFIQEGSVHSYLVAIAKFGKEKHTKMLINNAINQADKEQVFLLAVKYNNMEIVESLINYGLNVDGADEEGNTALHYATFRGDVLMVGQLLKGGAKMTIENMEGNNPAFLAILLRLEDIFSLYLDNGFDVNHKNSQKKSALYIAIGTNQTNIVKTILDRGASVGDRFQNELTPLALAVRNCDLEVIKLLLSYGADVNEALPDGSTALHKAAEKCSSDILQLLINKGGSLISKSKEGLIPLHVAVKAGHLPNVKVILESLQTIMNITTDQGLQSIHVVAEKGNLDILEYLVQKGANLNARDRNKETPLFKAASAGNANVVRRLIQYGVNLESCTYWGWSPLHIATTNGHENIVDLLLVNGAQVNAMNVELKTPMFEAVFYDREKIVYNLLIHGAKVNLPGKFNGIPITPLKLSNLLQRKRMSEVLRLNGGSERINGYKGPTYLESRIVSNRLEFIPSWKTECLQKWFKENPLPVSLSCWNT